MSSNPICSKHLEVLLGHSQRSASRRSLSSSAPEAALSEAREVLGPVFDAFFCDAKNSLGKCPEMVGIVPSYGGFQLVMGVPHL